VPPSRREQGDLPPGLARLPPGRHGLPREFIAENQRARLTAGMISAVGRYGYRDATITRIAEAAGLSRRTFYQYFRSKDECFLATFDAIAEHLLEESTKAAADHADWPDRVRAQLAAALEMFAANPDLARFCLIAPHRASGEISARYRLAISRTLAELTRGIPSEIRSPGAAVDSALIGGMAALIVRKVQSGEGERLPELLPDLTELFLAPYLGRDHAARVAHSVS
jgi:AcrR family transcriptional regulator